MLNTIKVKSLTNIRVVPVCDVPNKILNSLWSVLVIKFHNNDHREGIIQYIIGKNITPRKVDNQLSGILIRLEVGSKTENKFVIIFKLFLFFVTEKKISQF